MNAKVEERGSTGAAARNGPRSVADQAISQSAMREFAGVACGLQCGTEDDRRSVEAIQGLGTLRIMSDCEHLHTIVGQN